MVHDHSDKCQSWDYMETMTLVMDIVQQPHSSQNPILVFLHSLPSLDVLATRQILIGCVDNTDP
jgi:hypothetical protein